MKRAMSPQAASAGWTARAATGAVLLLAAFATASASTLAWNVTIDETRQCPFSALVEVTDAEGIRHFVPAEGEAFFVSDLGLVVSVQDPETSALPSRVVVMDLDGRQVWFREARSLTSPTISDDGRAFAYLEAEGISVIDLVSFSVTSAPRLAPFAVSGDGRVAGARADASGAFELVLVDAEGRCSSFRIERRAVDVAFDEDGTVLALTRASLLRLGEHGDWSTLFAAPGGAELRNLDVSDAGITVSARSLDGAMEATRLFVLSGDGDILRSEISGSRPRPASLSVRAPDGRGIPWPLAPDAQHSVGNTYGEFQYYGGAPYLHPGVDVMGAPGQAVYAVAPGVVKAILTTSGQWHWRVAIADSATSGTSTGYLYAHLDQPTIVPGIGDTVETGEYIGDLVAWPVAGFNHCHFARIEDQGIQWYGNWLATDNPHTDFDSMTETSPPVFEPARGSDLLAFCTDQTSTYLEPDALSGRVDIVAHVGDTIESGWVCSVQKIRYTIYPVGHPGSPVVDDRLAVNFDMALDTYSGGPIDPFLVGLLYKRDATCWTQGDYDYREFYHIITNSDGNDVYETSDLTEAWDTAAIPDADYLIRVTATDAAGNAASDSMTVTTDNGNASGVPEAEASFASLDRPFPNPASGPVTLAYSLPSAVSVQLSVYAPSGRLVRDLIDSAMPPGRHAVEWDLADENGRPVGSGLYLVMLRAGEAVSRRAIVVAP